MPRISEDDLFKGVEQLGISEDSLFTGLNLEDTIPQEAPQDLTGQSDVQTMEQMDFLGEKTAEKKMQDLKDSFVFHERNRIQSENPIKSSLYTRSADVKAQEAAGQNVSLLQKISASSNDALSMAGRLLTSASGFEGETIEDKMNNYFKEVGKTEGEGFITNMIKHPSTALAIAMAPYLGAGLMAAGAEGTGIALVNQMENMAEGRDSDLGQVLADVGLSMALPTFGATFKKMNPSAKKMVLDASEKVTNPVLKSISSELSGISEDALEMARSKGGRNKLIEMSGKADEMGGELLNMLDNIDDHYQYEAQLKTALNDMPDISIDNITNSLRNSMKKLGNLPNEIAAKSKIKSYLDGIEVDFLPKKIGTEIVKEGVPLSERGLGGSSRLVEKDRFIQANRKIPAKDYRKLRQRLDVVANFDEPGSDLFNDAMLKARTVAKEDLVGASKGTPYSKTIDNYSNMLGARDRLYKRLGRRSDVREDRIQSFMDNLFGKNKNNKQRILQNIDDVFGSEFTKNARISSMAKEITKDGKFPLFASQSTGRSMKADIGAFSTMAGGLGATAVTGNPMFAAIGVGTGLGSLGLSSPRVSPHMLNLGEDAMKGLSRLPQLGTDIMNNPILQRTVPGLGRLPMQNYLGEQ